MTMPKCIKGGKFRTGKTGAEKINKNKIKR